MPTNEVWMRGKPDKFVLYSKEAKVSFPAWNQGEGILVIDMRDAAGQYPSHWWQLEEVSPGDLGYIINKKALESNPVGWVVINAATKTVHAVDGDTDNGCQ